MGDGGCRDIEWNSFACSRFPNVDAQYLAPAWAQDLTTIFGYVWVRRDVEEQYKRLALDRTDDWLNSAARTQIDHRKEGERLRGGRAPKPGNRHRILVEEDRKQGDGRCNRVSR